ncbi:PREDICTED: folylpolyglutamate synthase, mitochondrial-like [Habropoda laboriosa]|uniref:folylpolyglutamate synthase, mitochondrial-like n=1 Tax=Habropoda laboriosa TaxID=597456 RepID=UPI00083CF0FA|nr:PREDICTED: folylpolyglutamate synthase, mitochondrial-like [Habropoda laboriosa]
MDCLQRSGITLEMLNTLSVIHVAGTKGKGSACAYTEAILREHGFRTGFFSSPHLVSTRERIRINGQPVDKVHFIQYFWKIYKKLEDTKEHEFDMPGYFNFLTILMFDIFLNEDIDVAIIETGIGGLYDCTNLVRNPVCVGITSLALEHTSLLGNTLEDIAYQKSGIFKPQTVAFSVPQLPEAMQVLHKRSIEENCTLYVVPPFHEYMWENVSPILKVANKIQQQNASLAIQMAITWIKFKREKHSTVSESAEINVSMDKIAIGLSSCKWPGRMQILRSSVADFFLDGAHTTESIESGISWFSEVSNKRGKRLLIFNTSGTRDSTRLLSPLKSLCFYKAYFVPNYAGVKTIDDQTNCASINEEKKKCEINSKIWGTNSIVANSVFEVLQDIKNNAKQRSNSNNVEKYQVFVTGSLYLIGAVLAILDPNLTMTTKF